MEDEHKKHDQEAKEAILHDVKTHGCHLALLESDGYLPAFVYSIGLYKNYKHPEIIVFGLKPQLMGIMINYARDNIKEGFTFEPNKLYEGFLEGFPIQFIKVKEEHYPDYLGYGGWFYNQSWEFPVLQLVWPDKGSKWPWEEDFNPNWLFKQPLLDRNTDFKFYEPRNLGVYTTYHVLEGKPILYVYHNADGDWQFHSEDEPELIDAKLVCLEQLVKRDPSLNQLHYLGYGSWAWRELEKDKWHIETEDDNNTPTTNDAIE